MTNEQWIIYLYGIYPEGGFIVFWLLSLLVWGLGLIVVWLNSDNFDNKNPDSNYYYKNGPWYKLGKWKWIVPTTLSIFIFLSLFVPSKQTFLLIVATPSIMESLESEDGKLNKINKLLDKALDKADKYIEETK